MAFENTHLFAADAVRKLLGHRPQAELIGKNIDFYYLGAIFPDMPLFSRYKKMRQISHVMHGSTGISTHHIPLNLFHLRFFAGIYNFTVIHPVFFYGKSIS
jgi:hypothetical protein